MFNINSLRMLFFYYSLFELLYRRLEKLIPRLNSPPGPNAHKEPAARTERHARPTPPPAPRRRVGAPPPVGRTAERRILAACSARPGSTGASDLAARTKPTVESSAARQRRRTEGGAAAYLQPRTPPSCFPGNSSAAGRMWEMKTETRIQKIIPNY